MSAVHVCQITDVACSRGCGLNKHCVLDAGAPLATVTPRSAMPASAQLPPMADAHAQIIYALQRAEQSLSSQATALMNQMDYGAEFPGEDADRMKEAIAVVTAAATVTTTHAAPEALAYVIAWLDGGCDPKHAAAELRAIVARQTKPSDLLSEIVAEVERAMRKFPTWPTDPLHALAVLGEEFGELTKDVLQLTYEPHKTNRENVRTEALQTAAMALRFASSLDTYEYAPGVQHKQGDPA